MAFNNADTPLGRRPLPRADSPWVDNPWADTPVGRHTPPPRQTATAADSMHPTGMLSCFFYFLLK